MNATSVDRWSSHFAKHTGACTSPKRYHRYSAGGRDLRRTDHSGALVVDRLDCLDHELDAEAVMDEVVAGPSEGVRVRVIGQEADDRRGQRRDVVRLEVPRSGSSQVVD